MYKLFLLLSIASVIIPYYNDDKVDILSPISSSRILASASSHIKSSPPINVVNGSGMLGDFHVSNNLGEGMWVSDISETIERYNENTRKGSVWFLCEIDSIESVDVIKIWNHNQNEHTRRGLKKVYIESSIDGINWELIPCENHDYHIIPQSQGKNHEQADYILNLGGKKIKYLCITADNKKGNYYDMTNPIILQETKDMKQNPKYYGLSEIRFYKKNRKPISKLESVDELHVISSQGYINSSSGPRREFKVKLNKPLFTGGVIYYKLGQKEWKKIIEPDAHGVMEIDDLFPPGYMKTNQELEISFNSTQGSIKKKVSIPAARKWNVYFMPHSHLDIGYTHRQNDVMALQWRNLERAIELAEKTKDYPSGAQYKWNTEATWAVIDYLRNNKGNTKYDKLIKAIRNGSINVDAGLGSILTGICKQEELMHIFDDAHEIESITGVPCNTAMMSDVPGQVWGFATALSQNGVRYYSPGPNYVPFYGRIGNDRAAALHIKWGDYPFWWQSQSGNDKVLVWQAGKGYSWFHGWLAGRLSVCGVEPIWEYLTQLEMEEFPYDMCYLRYTVHGDNGPPDQLMPEVIKKWNEIYASPQFIITTSKSFFEEFESKYGEYLPVFAGDMTPTWEDGAASTSKETSMNRASASRLSQSQVLWSILRDKEEYPHNEFLDAWKNVILFSEHTWGAAGSGPEPNSKFTIDLWNGKKMYADSAEVQSKRLYEEALSTVNTKSDTTHEYIHVLNTNLWERTDVVKFSVMNNESDIQLINEEGDTVEVQKVSNEEYLFIAKNVPPLSSKVYKVIKNNIPLPQSHRNMAFNNVIDNGTIRVVIDTVSGNIISLTGLLDDHNYVTGNGLNDYLYSARVAKDQQGIEALDSLKITRNGPIAATIRTTAKAPGCYSLTRDITLYNGLNRIDIVNTIDKQNILDFENVRFVFPFNIDHPEIALDLAMSEVHPEREQLAGVNKHYYSINNGLSVADLEHGVCLITNDAPFIELGTPSGEDYRLNNRHGYGWWLSAQISPTIYSWVMTNTWRTNYKASQDGIVRFHYSLFIDNPLELKMKQRGVENEQKMVVFTSSDSSPISQLFKLSGNNKVSISTIEITKDKSGYIVALNNLSGKPVNTGFVWGKLLGKQVFICDFKGHPIKEINPESFWLKPYDYIRYIIYD